MFDLECVGIVMKTMETGEYAIDKFEDTNNRMAVK
jgi:hypothetical protein